MQLVTDEMLQRPSSFSSLRTYEDDAICWFYDYNTNVSSQHDALYSKKEKKLITPLWDSWDYLQPTGNGILALEYEELVLITPEGKETLLTFPDNPAQAQGVPFVFSGWQELSNGNHLFFAERYTFLNSTAGGPSLNDHLYDALYLVDDNYELTKTFWTEKGEKIICANERYLILLEKNQLFLVRYSSSDEREPFATINSHGGALTVEECGGSLLFFQGNELKQSVALPLS